jgi:EAL domain-containing protein (putative c-di-GMP-specific phosphodiesterase class I)
VTHALWRKLLIILIFLPGVCASSYAAEAPYIPNIDYLRVSPDAPITPRQALTSDSWQTLGKTSPNFGYINDTVWLRFDIPGGISINLLEVRYPQLDQIDFYLVRDGRITRHLASGDRFPFAQRPIIHRNFLFPFKHIPGVDYEILLKVQTQGAMQIPLRLWSSQDFFVASAIENQFHAVYYGILITVICFNLFIFLALRERVYLVYVLSTLSYLFLIASLNGTAFQMLWPTKPGIENHIMLLTIPSAMLFTLLFAQLFLKLKTTAPHWNRVVLFTILLNALAALSTFLTTYSISSQIIVALTIPSCLLLTVLGPLLWLRGNPQAVYYTLAWGALTLGSAITATNKYGLIPNNFLTTYGMEIGSALEAILLTIALAARLYHQRQDTIKARDAELQAMTARRSAELKLIEHALHNPLTLLPNRSSYEMAFNDLITRAPDRRYAVVIIHLNNLQSVTKTLGHQNSDQILKLAAQHYNAVAKNHPATLPVEKNDQQNHFLSSLDSQTFAMIMDADVAEATPRKIMAALEELRAPLDYLGMQIPLEVRVGTAIFPDHGMDTGTLIRRAVIAEGSERAKERGIAYYKPSRDSFSADRLTIVSELRQALIDNRLALYLQPKLSLATNSVVDLEALIRWPEKQGVIRPDEIIALAEQTGLIKPLTRWVLQQALTIRTRLLEHGWPLGISVNVSPNNLREPDFPLFVQRLMSSFHKHKGAITFEVTETSMMQDPANSLTALGQLNAAGIPVSIDDFGSGYSSLSYIKQLPASEIKIDRSLITELATGAEDQVIVQTTITMCHSLGYQVVAEGVEDETTAEILRHMGCDMIQGFLLTPPLPFDEALDWLNRHGRQQANRIGG